MIDFHKAIRAIHQNSVYIRGNNPENIKVTNSSNEEIVVDWESVNKWVDPETYKYQRAAEYPSFADQFDTLYHGGYDAWKAQIDAIKLKYPKV